MNTKKIYLKFEIINKRKEHTKIFSKTRYFITIKFTNSKLKHLGEIEISVEDYNYHNSKIGKIINIPFYKIFSHIDKEGEYIPAPFLIPE